MPELESLLRALQAEPEDVHRILVSLDLPRAARAARFASDRELPVPSGGQILRALRCRAGISLAEMARRLNVVQSTVSRWESSVTHANEPTLQKFLDVVEATPEERLCVKASGVAKVKAHRRPFDHARFSMEIERLAGDEQADPTLELQFLQIQAELWWFKAESGAKDLLRRVTVAYAAYLNQWGRFSEAAKLAEASLGGINDLGDPLAADALRVIAFADVHRWRIERPHLGLFTLQRALQSVRDERGRLNILADMAIYSQMAGRSQEAENYSRRAAGSRRSASELTSSGAQN